MVVEARNNYKRTDSSGGSYGNYVKIDHGSGIATLSAHMQYNSLKVKVGDKVKRGQAIGLIGNTGHSFGTHDHFEVWVNGVRKNPLDYTYAYPHQEVHQEDVKLVKRYYPIPTEKRDNTKNQVETLEVMNVRTSASVTSNLADTVSKGNIYNFYETKQNDGYMWFRIGDSKWIAQDKDKTYLKEYYKEDTKNEKKIKQLEDEINKLAKENEELKKSNDTLINDNNILSNKVNELNNQIDLLKEELKDSENYIFSKEITETKKYKIKLNKGEILLIKGNN